MFSPANLDLAGLSDAELIVCLNPMSSHHRGGFFSVTGPVAALVRGDNRRLVDRDLASLGDLGKRVLLFEPRADDTKVMGFNYMSGRRLDRVIETAVRTTTAALHETELGRQLRTLPRGAANRLRRPEGDPSSWPAGLFPPRLRSA